MSKQSFEHMQYIYWDSKVLAPFVCLNELVYTGVCAAMPNREQAGNSGRNQSLRDLDYINF